MPRFLVKKDTCVSHQGRLYKAGDVAEFDIPLIKVPRINPKTGKQQIDDKGALVFDKQPMAIGENLELIKDDAEPVGAKA